LYFISDHGTEDKRREDDDPSATSTLPLFTTLPLLFGLSGRGLFFAGANVMETYG
jgi:hypothetical protein